MRIVSVLLPACLLAACSTAPQPTMPTPEAQAKLQNLIAGRSPGRPITCLSSQQRNNMVVIDESTIAYRNGSRVYVNRLQGACSAIGMPTYALLTRTHSSSLCRGDIARVVHTPTGMIAGSCVIGDFVPYSR